MKLGSLAPKSVLLITMLSSRSFFLEKELSMDHLNGKADILYNNWIFVRDVLTVKSDIHRVLVMTADNMSGGEQGSSLGSPPSPTSTTYLAFEGEMS